MTRIEGWRSVARRAVAVVLVATALATPLGASAQQLGAPRRDEGRAIALTLVTVVIFADALAALGLGVYDLAVGPSCRQMDGATCARIATPNDDLRIQGGLALGLSAVFLGVGLYVAGLLDSQWNPRAPSEHASVTPWLSVDGQHAAGGMVIRW